MNQMLLVSVTFLCLVPILSASSFADTLYTNLEPGNVASAPGGYCLGTGTCATSYWIDAIAFTPSTTAALADIGITLAYVSGQNSATIQLLNDSGGLPGSLIESWTVNNLSMFQKNTPTTATFVTSNSNPILDAGQQYWVAVIAGTPGDKANLLYWMAPLPAAYTPFATSQDGGPYTIVANPYVGDGGFRVDGTLTPAPEPSSLMMLGSGYTEFDWCFSQEA
jgi:hypothetical protein